MALPPQTGQRGSLDLAARNPVAFTCLLCLAWILPGLIGHDPWKPDEAYSFGLVYHIIQSDVVPSTGEYCPYTHFFFRLQDGSFIAFSKTKAEREAAGEGTVQRYDGDHVTVLFDEHGYRELFVPVVLERALLRPA